MCWVKFPPERNAMSRCPYLLAAAWGLFVPGVIPAAELVAGRIEHEGHSVLESSFEISDSSDNGAIWLALGESHFQNVGPLPPAESASQRLRLDGEVRVIADRGNRGRMVAELRGLELVQSADVPDRWELPREEVLRTADAAGADLPFWYTLPTAFRVAGLAVLMLFATVLLAWFLRPKRKASSVASP